MTTRRVAGARSVAFATRAVLLAATSAWLCAASAHAALIGDLITVEATSSEGSAIPVGLSGAYDPNGVWSVPGPVELRTEGDLLIGTVEALELAWQSDPMVSLSFTANAGASDTTFTLSTATLTFPPLSNPTAFASTSLTLTDTAADGADLRLVGTNSGLFRALYNGSSVFAELLGPQSLSGGSVTVSEGTGFQTILGSVGSIQAQFEFTLSATDTASGNGQFTVVPEPSTALLLLLGLLPLLASAGRAPLRTRA